MARQRDCLCLTVAVTLIQVIEQDGARQARRTENVFLVGIVHYRGVHQRSAKVRLPGYCPPGSISSSQKHCGSAKVFCPEGSGRPSVASRGYYTVDSNLDNKTSLQTTRTTQLHCPIGSYHTWRP